MLVSDVWPATSLPGAEEHDELRRARGASAQSRFVLELRLDDRALEELAKRESHLYGCTSLKRKRTPLGPYRGPMPRFLGDS